MRMLNGKYHTEAGSTVDISGKHGGISAASFDWFAEPDACCDCKAQVYPEPWDFAGQWRLVWKCEQCGGGSARLFREEEI